MNLMRDEKGSIGTTVSVAERVYILFPNYAFIRFRHLPGTLLRMTLIVT